MLTCEILNLEPDSDGEMIVRFSCYDGDDTATIAFIDNISLPQACFHAMRVRRPADAFDLMCEHLDEFGTEAVVHSVFHTE